MPKDITRTFQRLRVAAGYVFAAVFLVLCRPTLNLLIIGLAVALVGLFIRGWATGHLRKQRELDTSGPYAYTRNPLYLGSFIITVGFGVASGVWWLAVLAIIFYLGIYLPVMNVERAELERVIGDDYRRYAEDVPAFIPGLKPWKKSGRRFDFQLYLKNGEYNAAVGVLLAAIFLIIKGYYQGSL
jgi:protein-S-isoprenylcysteine O-methyltransferase Ste14